MGPPDTNRRGTGLRCQLLPGWAVMGDRPGNAGFATHGLHPEPAGAWSVGSSGSGSRLAGSCRGCRAWVGARGGPGQPGAGRQQPRWYPQMEGRLPWVGRIRPVVLTSLLLHLDGGAGGRGGRLVALTDCIRQTVIDPAWVYPWCLISINSSLKELARDSALSPPPVPSSSFGLSGMEDL